MTGEWFSERGEGMGQEFRVLETLCDRRSPYQHIQIFRTRSHGLLLALDGIIQLTEADEFAYHEMLVHSALMAHAAPEQVLIIGGGDGGAVRETARHPEVRRICWCEIDAEVVACCREFIPGVACANDDPRVEAVIGDGAEYVRRHREEFDVIIVDSTDPGGAAEPLFGVDFYRDCRRAMRPGGVISAQGESPFLLPDTVKSLVHIAGSVFRNCRYSLFHVPTYPTGAIGACMASDNPVDRPVRTPAPELARQLRYYTPEIHVSSMVLPAFVNRLLSEEDS